MPGMREEEGGGDSPGLVMTGEEKGEEGTSPGLVMTGEGKRREEELSRPRYDRKEKEEKRRPLQASL